MFDELGRLAADEKLKELLAHYALLGEPLPETWHPRHALVAGIDQLGLVRLHGALIAFGWIEQNTGGPGCSYRITAAGRRALKRVRSGLDMEDDFAQAA